MCFLAQTGKSGCAIRVRRQATGDRRTRVTMEIQEERIRPLNEKYVREGDYVLYWMQEAQRAEYNHALEYAVQRANELGQPLLVIFGLMTDYPEANLRHYAFSLEGLQDVKEALKERKIKFVVRWGSPDEVAREGGRSSGLRRRSGRDRGGGAGRARLGQAGARGANIEAQDPGTPRRVPGRARTYHGREAILEYAG